MCGYGDHKGCGVLVFLSMSALNPHVHVCTESVVSSDLFVEDKEAAQFCGESCG